MNTNLESTNIFDYLMSIDIQEWRNSFHNQDLHYKGFTCKFVEKDPLLDIISGTIYFNSKDLKLYVNRCCPYKYARDFWRTVDTYLSSKKNEH